MQQLSIVLAAATVADIDRLSAALAAGGRAAVSRSPQGGEQTVIVTSFSEADIAAAGRLLSATAGEALIAAQISPHFAFVKALQARARNVWGTAAVLIPPLRATADFIIAADAILARCQEAKAATVKVEAPSAALLADAATALAEEDIERARNLLAMADTKVPLARVLSLRLKIQTAASPPAVQGEVKQLEAAVKQLSEAEKTASGAGAFLAAIKARLAMDDVL